MRSIRGYIRNLADGLGPPAGSVTVNAKPEAISPESTSPDVDLDLTTHRLGAVNYVHLEGSGSQVLADTTGHFGWDMELAPGPIQVYVRPDDPPPSQFRRRFPDESAQIGKAYISDLERLGWAGGKDHLIWNAVFGGDNPTTTQWNPDPTESWRRGNGSLDLGSTPGRVTIRRFIAMLGGVPFTVEMGDLVIPITGEDARPTNPSGQDRWDLICARIDWNPDSPTYGKQSFEFTTGTPGGAIPPMTPNGTDNYRRLLLHAVKMAAGSGVYSGGTDLRPWAPGSQPDGIKPAAIAQWPISIPSQTISVGNNQGAINTALVSSELRLPLSCAWDGMATLHFTLGSLGANHVCHAVVSTEGRETAAGPVIAGTNYAVAALNESGNAYPRVYGGAGTDFIAVAPITLTFPLRRIPSGESRTWSRLRFTVQFFTNIGARVVDQSLAIHLWPVT